jgi:hypothetical protein
VANEREVAFETAHYPPADISPAEFEVFVAQLFESVGSVVSGLEVVLHDRIQGVDGTYDFDATVRFRLAGMQLLVVVEAKRYKNPIKRELVQVLHRKLQSVGAHKAVMIATAPYQRGALSYAKTHGIALVTVTEGRFTFETKAKAKPLPMSRQEAAERFSLPAFVGHAYHPGETHTSTRVTLVSPEYPNYVAEELLGLTVDESR